MQSEMYSKIHVNFKWKPLIKQNDVWWKINDEWDSSLEEMAFPTFQNGCTFDTKDMHFP